VNAISRTGEAQFAGASSARRQPSLGWAYACLPLPGGTPVVLAAPLNSQAWLAARIEEAGAGPWAFVLGVPKASRCNAAAKFVPAGVFLLIRPKPRAAAVVI